MRHLLRFSLGLSAYLFSKALFANETIAETKTAATIIAEEAPQVGKHVMANMDASSMILSLLMVLAIIIVSAFVLKRFNIVQQGSSHLSVVTSLSLGAKERVIVVQVGNKQLLLGVTSQQVTLLDSLAEPINTGQMSVAKVPLNIVSFLSSIRKSKTEKTL